MAKKKSKKEDRSVIFSEKDFLDNEMNYTSKNIADETKRYSIISGINRNVARHIPSGYDGLKPVARRVLLILAEDKKPVREWQKVNAVSGNVMGKYHPHGDDAIEEVIGKMGQYWTNNVLYVEPSGNFGNLSGDGPAAGRYIKCRLSRFAYKCFFEDYKYASIEMKPSYTGKYMEPEYLPSKYPVAIVNPQFSSIGYGTAANIAPYNLTEVLEATIKLIHDPDADIKLIPDFPNGCEVVANKELDEINTNGGRGKVTVRATIDVDHEKNTINIYSLPLKIGSKTVVKNLANLIIAKKIEGIKDIKDNTSPKEATPVNIQIILDKNVNPDKMVDQLIKRDIGLQKTFGVQIKFIEDYKERDYTPKEYLLNWLDFRREIVQSMHNKKYIQLKEDEHMNEIKIFVFSKDNMSKTLKIVRQSKNDDESIKRLMDEYRSIHMTSLQAKTICNMRFREFNQDSYQKFLSERERLSREIKESEKIIQNPSLIDEIIEKELKEGIELFGEPRRSKIVYEKKTKDDIPSNPVLIAISKDGFVKKVDYKKYSSVGVLGNTSSQEVIVIKIANNRNLLVLDSNGKASKVPVIGIPEMTPSDNGVQASRYFNVTGRIIGVMDELTDKDIAKEVNILFVTKNGYAKRTKFKEFLSMREIKTAITLNDGDELIFASLEMKGQSKVQPEVIIYTDLGNGIRLALDDIPESGSSSKGKRVIQLSDGEYVAGAGKLQKNKKLLFYMTSSGRGKVTEEKYFPRMGRKDTPVSLLPLTTTERLVSVVSVNKTDNVIAYRKLSDPETIAIESIKPSLRVAKPEKLIRVPKGDIIVGIQVYSPSNK